MERNCKLIHRGKEKIDGHAENNEQTFDLSKQICKVKYVIAYNLDSLTMILEHF